MRKLTIILVLAAAAAALTVITMTPPGQVAKGDAETAELLAGDPARGRELFVSEACVVCHSVRDVGGRAGPPLDVTTGVPPRDPWDFAARMWMGAPVMLKLQDAWVGYQIDLTGEELRHLAAFANDPAAQDELSADDLPDGMERLFLDQFYIDEDLEDRYRGEEWLEFSGRRGR